MDCILVISKYLKPSLYKHHAFQLLVLRIQSKMANICIYNKLAFLEKVPFDNAQ